MPEMTAHPSREQLSAYNLGQLRPEEAVAVESHISECEPCCDTIISLSSDDTFVGLLKQARQLPTDQTVDHGVATAHLSCQAVPAQLAEHPRYEILGLIGKGGMGDVYKARHRKMERLVALKVINRGLVQKTEAVDRFHREVKAAAQLSHPNIVTAFDADQAGDFHFMVMEYVDGVDLSQTVKVRGALPVAEACDYIRQAAIGLQHAHTCGMVHRDIKPHNLMVTKEGTVKILDFGLASLAPDAVLDPEAVGARSDLTAAGAIMGTPDFISPEQADDARKADIRSDIYSLGATLYFLLAGRPPFAEGSVTQKLKSHAQVEPEPLKSLRDDIPPELVAIVTKMTAKDADERYLTPKDVAAALEGFLRTWRSAETESLEKDLPLGGDGSVANGNKPAIGSEGPKWLPVAAKWLFYLAWVPIALLMWEVNFTDFTSDTSDYRFWFYISATLCLSTIAGALSAAQRFQTDLRKFEQGDLNAFRLKAEETLLIVGILIFSVFAVVHYYQTNHGVVRVEVNDPSLEVSINNETITMKDGDGKTLTIRPGEQSLIIRKADADFEFETDRFQIRRGDEIAFKVEMLQGEIVVRRNGERFHSKALPDDVRLQQILDRMAKAYAACDSYHDSGVIKTVTFENTDSSQITFEHSFTTVFERPARFRFEIKDEDDDRLLISANGQDVRTWWDVEPGIQKPESLEIAMAQALGFAGGDVSRIPALLMPEKLEGWGDLNIIAPKQIEDGKLRNVACFRLEYNFRDEQITLWIDKQSYLVRQIDERIKTDGIRIERTTTYDPTIDGKITGEMLEFDPPSSRATDESATPEARTILDQGYTILDGGKEIGSRRLIATKNDQIISIDEELSLALTFDGVPPGIVELDVSAVYSLAGETPRITRATTSAKEQGALVMHGTVDFENGEALAKWTTYKERGRKLEPPRKQQATLKEPPTGPLVLDSTIQVVGPLLLPDDGERKFVRARFNNEARENEALIEFETECRLRRTSRPEGAGFTIEVFEPNSDEPEMTWEYDSQGKCESVQLTPTTVMKPHEASEEAEADIAPVGGRSESSNNFEREAAK